MPVSDTSNDTTSQEETQVYVVTSGVYSDYSIHAVFSKEDEAQRYCDAHNAGERDYGYGPNYRVEMYTLDEPNAIKVAESGEGVWTVWIGGDGEARTYLNSDDTESPSDSLSDKGNFRTDVRAKDKETAIKVAQERLMQHKARLAGAG